MPANWRLRIKIVTITPGGFTVCQRAQNWMAAPAETPGSWCHERTRLRPMGGTEKVGHVRQRGGNWV